MQSTAPHAPETIFVVVATATPRLDQTANEDAVACLSRPPERAVRAALVLCDGVGSVSGAKQASHLVAQSMMADLVEAEEFPPVDSPPDFARLFALQAERLTAKSDTDASLKGSLATTCLVATITDTHLHLGYVGNGGAFHFRGDAFRWSGRFVPGLYGANLIAPHVEAYAGQNALTRFLSDDMPDDTGSARHAPTCLSISRDARNGDMLLLCSDGVFSGEEAFARDDQGGLWQSIPVTLSTILIAVRDGFDEIARSPDTVDAAAYLTWCLSNTLERLRAGGSLQDDASVALLVTSQALARHMEIRESARITTASQSVFSTPVG